MRKESRAMDSEWALEVMHKAPYITVSFIDEAIYLALKKGVTVCTFGDLVRVPGTKMSLAGAREQGAKIRIVYSPADAEKYAREHHTLR